MPTSTLFGHFDDAARTFVLTSDPPRKWRNIHTSDPGPMEIYAETSNLGDGPVTIRDEPGNTCNLVGYDAKYLYIRDEATNTVFTPWGDPVPTPVTNRLCTYHAAYTAIESCAAGWHVRQTVFVPLSEPVEIWRATIRNEGTETRRVSLFAYAMFQLTGTNSRGGGVWKDNDSSVFPELRAVWVHNRDRSVPAPWFNGFLATTSPGFAGACGYRDFFTRESYSLADPKILAGWNCDNRGFRGPDCAGILQVTLELAPGEEAHTDFFLGCAAASGELATLAERWSREAVGAALAARIATENRRSSAFRVDTGDGDRDALINHFVKKSMTSYLVNKSGFRDNLQNDMGISLFDWPMARANLLRAISSQYHNGSVPHGFRPWNHQQYADKPAWMLHCIPWCLKESGELGFLDERLPYCDHPENETVWEHMLRAMRFLVHDTGAHGLCDQHFADWNDGLEPSEKTGARESVMVTQQLCLGLLEVAELARRRGEDGVEREARDWHAHFNKLLNEVAWDGAWYVRTLCSGDYTLGSSRNDEGKIFVNTQSWAILSQTAPPDRAAACMEAVDRLIETDFGFSIAAPPFTKFDERIGKFSASRPLLAENGGCYNHAAGFKGVADCLLGRAEQAWRTYLKVAPGSPWNPISNSQVEPFSFTNCYSLTPERPGLAMYPWRTGTAAWFTQLLVEWILGARRHYDGLLIDPCLPAALPRASLTRTFRGATYHIQINNPDRHSGRRPCKISLDGQPLPSALLPILPAGSVAQVIAST
ncbi:MAG: glycosyl transferase [Terrimicrobiaceae bacterium]